MLSDKFIDCIGGKACALHRAGNFLVDRREKRGFLFIVRVDKENSACDKANAGKVNQEQPRKLFAQRVRDRGGFLLWFGC